MVQKEFTYSYNGKKIPFTVWLTEDSGALDTVVFLGTVQVGKLAEWVARDCPPRTAIVQGAPQWFAKEDGSDTAEFMYGFTESAFKSLQANYSFKSLHVIAESQAVPGVVLLFNMTEYKHCLKSAVLLQPLGFTANIFAGTDEQRLALFKKRIIKNAYHQLTGLLLDSRLRHNHRQLTKLTSFRDPQVKAQYNSGLKHDSLPELKQLLSHNSHVTIICGSNDKIFPPHEIKASLKLYGLKVPLLTVVGVPHSPPATKQGNKLMAKAFSLLR